MKLRNIYVICRDNYSAIKNISANNVTINNRIGMKVTGWNNAKTALLTMRKVATLEEESNKLIDSVPEFFRTQDTFNVNNDEWNKISSAKTSLLRTMDDTIDLYEKMGMGTESRCGLDIKLPQFNDFSEFVKYVNEIEFILTKCPFLQAAEEKLVFENVDVGSTWLTFFVVGGAALAGGSILLNNFAAFIDKCIVIRSHYLTMKKQKDDLEKAERDEKQKEIILNYITDLYKREIDNAIRDLEKITSYEVKNKDGDEIGRIEHCFEKMGNLIDKGLQIYTTIDSPAETRVLFEPLEMKYLNVNRVLSELEQKKDE